MTERLTQPDDVSAAPWSGVLGEAARRDVVSQACAQVGDAEESLALFLEQSKVRIGHVGRSLKQVRSRHARIDRVRGPVCDKGYSHTRGGVPGSISRPSAERVQFHRKGLKEPNEQRRNDDLALTAVPCKVSLGFRVVRVGPSWSAPPCQPT